MSDLSNESTILDKELNDLKRRLKATRKGRIEASKRLRKKNDFFEKITYFYSLIVLVLSVWFLNESEDSSGNINKVLLVLSLSLTYFTMFINMRNYKERASNFEANYQQLDVLNNKIDRFIANKSVLNIEKLKEFQREYERLIIGKENHLNIDYYISTEENKMKFSNEIFKYKIKDKFINTIVAIYPILLVLIIYLVWLFINKV